MVPDSFFYVPEKSMTSGRSSFDEPQERQLGQTLQSQTQTSGSQDRNRRRRFWCTRCSTKSWWRSARFSACRAAGVEGSGEGRRAGKRGVRTFPCTLPRLATSSTPSMSTDFWVGTAAK